MGIPYDGDDLGEMERAIYDGRGVHPAAALRQIAKLRGVRLVVDQWRDDYTHAAEAMVRIGAQIESGGASTRKGGASGNAEANETSPGVSDRSTDDAGTTTPTPVTPLLAEVIPGAEPRRILPRAVRRYRRRRRAA